MSGLMTSVIGDRHDYTRSKAPWIITEYKTTYERFVQYLAGGGIGTFGRTVRQAEVGIRQGRFLKAAAALGVLWALFWFF